MDKSNKKRTEIVKYVKIMTDNSRYVMPITKIEFQTNVGNKLVWRIPIEKEEQDLKEITGMEIEFVVMAEIEEKTYLIEQVRVIKVKNT